MMRSWKESTSLRAGAALVVLSVVLAGQLVLGSVLAQDQDDDVVRVNADLVVVNATVLDKNGKFISGLKRTDFQIFEDGTEQKVASFTAEETPFAAAILLDTSGSMETRLTLGRSAAIRFLDGLRDEDVAAAYNFDVKVEQMQDFSPGRDLPARAVRLHTNLSPTPTAAPPPPPLDLAPPTYNH